MRGWRCTKPSRLDCVAAEAPSGDSKPSRRSTRQVWWAPGEPARSTEPTGNFIASDAHGSSRPAPVDEPESLQNTSIANFEQLKTVATVFQTCDRGNQRRCIITAPGTADGKIRMWGSRMCAPPFLELVWKLSRKRPCNPRLTRTRRTRPLRSRSRRWAWHSCRCDSGSNCSARCQSAGPPSARRGWDSASHAELRNAHGVALHLELVSRRIVFRKLAHATRIAETGRVIVVVIPRIGVGIVVDDTAALLRIIRLGPNVVRYPRVGRPGRLTGVRCSWPVRRSDSPAPGRWSDASSSRECLNPEKGPGGLPRL